MKHSRKTKPAPRGPRPLAVHIRGILAGGALALIGGPAGAVLQDHGPGDPVLGWPQWYRDTNGLAVGLCKSQTPSPNPDAAGGILCFPIVPDPAAFAGNVGEEIFYNILTKAASTGPNFALTYVASLEAAYAVGSPVRGEEVIFSRARIRIDTGCVGTFVITHPLGVNTETVASPGVKAINVTIDRGLGAPGDFDAVLSAPMGPFLQWDVVNPGETLTAVNAAGVTEQFLGDPNYEHTFTGSPFGNNYIRVEAPAGCDIDGGGGSVVTYNTANVLGQKWTAPIPANLRVTSARYSRSLTGQNRADVQARSVPGQSILLTGAGGDMPSLNMVEETNAAGAGTGTYYAHLEWAGAQPPGAVSVTNVTSNPVNTVSAQLADIVYLSVANFDVVSGELTVRANSSDESSDPPLAVVGLPGQAAPAFLTAAACAAPALLTDRCYSTVIAANFAPPFQVAVESARGGTHLNEATTVGNNPMNPPVAPQALPDAPAVAGNGPTTFNVLANDVTNGVPVSGVVIISPPALGAAVASATSLGDVTFTPAPGASGPDSFTYVFRNTAGGVSSVATVSYSVPFVAPAPTVLNDEYGARNAVAKTLAVLANDTAAVGTALDPASIQIGTAPTRGAATPNANGTITYTANAGNANNTLDSFTYTVANTAGTRSTPATVRVVSFTAAESVSITRADYRRSTARYTLTGTDNWASTSLLAQSVTCYLGTVMNPAQKIGSGPISTAGAWSITQDATAPVIPATQTTATVTCQSTHGGIGQRGVTFR